MHATYTNTRTHTYHFMKSNWRCLQKQRLQFLASHAAYAYDMNAHRISGRIGAIWFIFAGEAIQICIILYIRI